MRQCKTCSRSFPVEHFQFDSRKDNRRKRHCVDCCNARQRQDRLDNGDARRAADRVDYVRNAEKVYHRNLMRRYGLSPEQVEQIKNTIQCDLCGEFSDGRKFVVDHCHASGKVRGLLCASCNLGLGHFKDNPTLLREAARYIDCAGFGLLVKG